MTAARREARRKNCSRFDAGIRVNARILLMGEKNLASICCAARLKPQGLCAYSGASKNWANIMKSICTVAAAALFAVTGCATQTQTTYTAAAAPVAEQSAEKADGEREICRREQIVGSRFHKRICMSQEEWEIVRQRTEVAKDDINKTRRAQSGCSGNFC